MTSNKETTMNLITILHKLLDRAYRKAAARATARAVKAEKHREALADEAQELAQQLQAVQAEHQHTYYEIQSEHAEAARIERQRSKAADLFGGI
nr:MAG: hypothetical protein [Bacteriophage sp.]